MRARLPDNEPDRLRALYECCLLDTPPEDTYDRIARVAAQVFLTPIAAISLIAEDRQFLKSVVGMEARESPRDIAFCAHAILSDEPMVVLDARLDPRFSDNPLVTGEAGIRFYCGAALKTPDGFRIGALCVIDSEPRTEVPQRLIDLLRDLAAQASTEIRHRKESLLLARMSGELSQRERELEREKQLRYDTEIRAELALEAGALGSWEWDAVSGRALLSPVMQRLLGKAGTNPSFSYRQWLKCIHPQDRHPVAAAMRTVGLERDVFTSEFRVVLRGGRVRWLALRGCRRRDPDGKVTGANGICGDITERRKANEELRASEEVFRGISAASPVGIFKADLRGNVCYVNPRNLEIWAMTEEEIMGAGWISRIHPDDTRSVVDGFRQASAEGRTHERELRLLLPDGALRWVHARSSILRDRSGAAIGMVGTIDDITERKSLEEERHANLELTRRVLDSTADFIKVLDLEGRLLSPGPGSQRAVGVADLRPLIGRDYISLWEGEAERAAARTALRAAVAGGTGSFQGFFPLANGELRWWDTIFTPVLDQAGRPERILSVARDMTELRRTSEQQERARHLAEEANRAKTIFLANVSHELRTPLSGVLGMTELLLLSDLDPEQQELAETVNTSGTALLALVNDLLDLSRVETGKLDCKRAPFDLKRTVNHAVALIASAAAGKGIELAINYPDGFPALLLGDEDRLRQILLNYLNNALKFTDFGRITIDVKTETADAAAHFLIAVRDTGAGIPNEAQPSLFTPFRQADASSTRKHGGLGLGLAISKRLAEAMGGSVGFTSAPANGSTFWLRLPLKPADRSLAERNGDLRAPKVTPLGGRPRVLVAEDNPINQKLVLHFLTILGCDFDVAGDGAIALRLYEQNAYDLVLMDCQMPELDGYEATSRIRQFESRGNLERTPIIAVTAHGMIGDRERSLAAGMDDHIVKPLRLEALRDAIAKWHIVPV